eukprot:9758526-Alexandrium_andersonii.AAC.1
MHVRIVAHQSEAGRDHDVCGQGDRHLGGRVGDNCDLVANKGQGEATALGPVQPASRLQATIGLEGSKAIPADLCPFQGHAMQDLLAPRHPVQLQDRWPLCREAEQMPGGLRVVLLGQHQVRRSEV